jgi:hypothetical protein
MSISSSYAIYIIFSINGYSRSTISISSTYAIYIIFSTNDFIRSTISISSMLRCKIGCCGPVQ